MASESISSSPAVPEIEESIQSDFPPEMIAKSITVSLEGLLWIILAVLTVFLRLWMLGARVMSHDESLHVYYSWQLAIGNGYAHNPMMHGPFLFEATALVNAIFGANDFTSRLVPAILGMLVAILIPLLLRPWLGRIGALAAALLFIFSPYFLYYSRYIRHDMQVIAWTLLAFVAIVSYQRTRSSRSLFLLAASLALMFTTMEITFIYLAIFTAFLIFTLLLRYRRWAAIRQSAEFDLLIIMSTLGAFFSSPIALLAVNPLWNRIAGAPFVDLSVLDSFGIEWAATAAGPRLWGLLVFFSLAALAIGWWWGKLLWLKLAGIFLGITLLLFTTLFTNPAGVGTGFIGSLGYWLSQHSVQRGSQPWFYYLLVFPLYEYAPLLLGTISGGYFMVRRKRFTEPVGFFIFMSLFWAVSIWLGMSIAGEKMPWLSTHLVLPWILLSGWGTDQILNGFLSGQNWRRPRISLRLLLAGATGLLVLVSIRTSYMVNFINYDYTTEPIGYAHSAPGVKWALEDITAIAERTGKGSQLVVAYDDQVAWPMSWYLRGYPGFFGSKISPGTVEIADVVIVSAQNWQKADLILGAGYKRHEVVRIWWPIEDYKSLSPAKIVDDLTNPAMRSALWQILWNRDYSAYGAVTGQTAINPPREWPLQDRMRIYIRADLADYVSSGKLAAYQLDDLPAIADAYEGLRVSNDPVDVLSDIDLTSPRNLVFAGQDILYVLDTGKSRVLKVNTNGETLNVIGSRSPEGGDAAKPGTFNEPWGIALDPDGNLYIADTWNHRIQKFDENGNFLLEWGSGGLRESGPDYFWGPRAIAVGSDGRVYVTDTGNRRVAVFSSTGQFLFDFDQAGDALLDEPVGLALHEEHVYIADTWNRRIAVFTPEGKFQTSWPVHAWNGASVDNKPYLVVDKAGSIFTSDPEGFRVIQFSPTGDPLIVLGQSRSSLDQFMLPTGLAIDSQGQLWITDAATQQLLAYSISQ